MFTYASIYIQAWIFGSSDIVFTQTDTRGSGIAVSPTIAMPRSFNIDTHLFLVRVSYQENILTYSCPYVIYFCYWNFENKFFKSQAVDGAHANYVFEGTGSALSDGSAFFQKIGAVVYSYNPKEVNIWYPGAEDYLIFVGGIWVYEFLLPRHLQQRVYLWRLLEWNRLCQVSLIYMLKPEQQNKIHYLV